MTPRRIRALLAVALVARPAGPAVAQVPADTTSSRTYPIPFLFYQPETSVGGGVGLLHTWRGPTSPRASSASAFLVLTAKSQYSMSLGTERFATGRWTRANFTWSRFPDTFFGVGNATIEAARESYTLQQIAVLVDARREVRPHVFVGLQAAAQRARTRDLDSAVLLTSGNVPGSAGGGTIAAGPVMAVDTRDNLFSTRRGTFAQFGLRTGVRVLGADYGHTRFEVDLRQFHPVGRHVFAAQVLLTGTAGTAPFYDMATLGGESVLRGYFAGRFRERNRVVAQGEWRFPVHRRLSGVAFAGAGEVMHDWGDFTTDGLHGAWGGGIRFLLSPQERVNLRIDYGVGRGDSGLYFGFSEAF